MDLLERLGPAGVAIIPLQVLGELLNVCRRKNILPSDHAVERVRQFLAVFNCPQTSSEDLIGAAILADRHRLQFFDALIMMVAARAGATVLLSEDLQDGFEVQGLRIMNPFAANNRAELEALLS